ncbi:MAG TPA: cyclic nucleotide-binding domain-containing protein [Actinomycetota bacterium]|jgi:CRP-like cAMP-binding protein
MSDPVDIARLRLLPLFGDLDQHDLMRLAMITREITIPSGGVLIAEGDLPYEVLVIEEGEVDVVRDGERLASLGPGDVVGEMGLLEQQRRMATVTARTDVRAVAISADDLNVLAREMPEVVGDIRTTAADRERRNRLR